MIRIWDVEVGADWHWPDPALYPLVSDTMGRTLVYADVAPDTEALAYRDLWDILGEGFLAISADPVAP